MFLKTCSRTLDQWQSFNATAEQKHLSNQKYFEIAKRTNPRLPVSPSGNMQSSWRPCFWGGKNAYSFPQPGWTPIFGKWPNLRLAATNLLSKWSLSAWCQFVIAPDRATEQRREKNQSAHQAPPTGCNLTSCNSSNTVQEHNCVTDKTISTTIIWHHGNMGWSSKFQWQLLSLGCLVLGQSWL